MISEKTLLLQITLTAAFTLGSNSTHNPNVTITAPHKVIGSISRSPDFLVCDSDYHL